VVSAWLWACGAAQHPLPPGEPRGAAVDIEAVKGTQITVNRATLTDGLALERARRRNEPFERYLLQVDEARVRGWYVRHGFFRAQVHAEAEEKGTDVVRVVFHVDEGHRAKLKKVEIAGLPNDPNVDRDEIRAIIKLEDGKPFDYDAFDLAKTDLAAVLGRWGYAKAKFTASVAADQVTDEATIRLEYTPGPRCTFGKVTLLGVDGKLATSARDRLAIEEGALYSTNDLADSRAALYDMNRFSMVRIEPDLAGDGTVVPVKIEVTLSTTHELRLGGGVGMNPTSYEVRARAGYSITGFPGQLDTMHFELRPALVRLRDSGQWEPRVEALTSIEHMDLFRPFMTGVAEVGVQYLTVEAYTTDGPHVQLGVKTPLWGRHLQVAAFWHLEQLEFRNLSPAVSPTLARTLGIDGSGYNYRLGYYEQSVIADWRNNPVEATRGVYGDLRLHEGTIAAGGAYTYLRVMPELRGYYPLGPVVFASRARAGAIFGTIPATERFFSGGANSMRGFGERRLSPFVDTVLNGQIVHVPYGGGALLELSEEVRFPIGTLIGLKIGGVAFIDGGDDTETLSELDPTHLHWAAGPGLRVHTIIGAIRLDVAYRLDRYQPGNPQPGDRIAFHLSIGEAF
jgi:translocation and assembly module TamA